MRDSQEPLACVECGLIHGPGDLLACHPKFVRDPVELPDTFWDDFWDAFAKAKREE